ncbi:MAG: aspartate aminotransferase family protein [Planctomycetota bacterium]
MTTRETIELFQRYVVPNYGRVGVVFVRGEGSRLWDADGKRYLDLFPGWGVNLLGHCHPRVVEALRRQAGELLHVANTFYSEPQGKLAKLISERSFGGQCFFCNSGAEAVEAAIKLARKHSAPDRYKIVTMENSFHGRTLGAVSATAQAKYHEGFQPIVGGFVYARYNDLGAAEAAVDAETCAVMLEVVQGEGGINIADKGYLRGLRELADRKGALLIFDEVQTGVGRTGEWFGHVRAGVEPDILTLAKGLGGGVAIGAMEAKAEIAKALVPGSHASTFGGNPLAAAAACATFEAIEEEGMLANVRNQAVYVEAALRRLAREFPFIREVRVAGMMIGVELDRKGGPIVERALARGLIINCTHDTVLRLLPALNVTREELDEGLSILKDVLEEEER